MYFQGVNYYLFQLQCVCFPKNVCAMIANKIIIVCTYNKNHENCELKFNEELVINDFNIV